MTCGRQLAPGQWFNFCGETDMGQTAPALCTQCGGPFKLKEIDMSSPESRLLTRMPAIEQALTIALAEAAGEPMGFVLMVVPINRVGEHIISSNIAENQTIAKFLRDAARTVKCHWAKAQDHAQGLIKKTIN